MAQRNTRSKYETFQELFNGLDENCYEAHQKCRTIVRRYIRQEKYAKAIQWLYDGSMTLSYHRADGSVADLAHYMIETYSLAKLPVNEESLVRVYQLLPRLSLEEPSSKRFISKAISWSTEQGEYQAGEPELRHHIGKLFYEKGLTTAVDHLILGTDESAILLGELASKRNEADGEIARIMIQLLLGKNIRHTEQGTNKERSVCRASLAFGNFEKLTKQSTNTATFQRSPGEEAVKIQVFDEPWSNFAQLLLLTVQRDTKEQRLFQKLLEKYTGLLKNQVELNKHLQDIGLTYFSIAKPPQQMNPMDIINSLFGGGMPPANSNRLNPPQLD